MFRGTCPTRLDEKGRLKIPADFKREIDRNYDGQFYLTSRDGKVIQLYPLKEWETVEQKMATLPSSSQVLQKFLNITSLWGAEVALDSQARLTIPERHRNKFRLEGNVSVIGKLKYFEIRLTDEFEAEVEGNPLNSEDMDELARLGI